MKRLGGRESVQEVLLHTFETPAETRIVIPLSVSTPPHIHTHTHAHAYLTAGEKGTVKERAPLNQRAKARASERERATERVSEQETEREREKIPASSNAIVMQ